MKNYLAGGGDWGVVVLGGLGCLFVFCLIDFCVCCFVVLCLARKRPRAFTLPLNKVILSEALILL